EHEVEEEKKVVLQEIVRANANFETKSYLYFDKIVYANKGAEHGALGTSKTVQKITCEDVKNFIKKYFVSNNCTISIYSPLKLEEIKYIIEKNFIDNISFNNDFISKEPNLKMGEKSAFKLKQANIDKNYLYFAFRSNYGFNNDFNLACLHILTGIMSNLKYGIMNEIRLKKSLTYYADFTFEVNKDNSPIIFSTECSKENVKECLNVLANYIKQLIESGITQEQLDKQIREEIYYFETMEKTISKEINKIYNAGRYKIVEDDEILELMKKVTINDLNKMIKDVFVNPTFACLVYGDAEAKDVFTLEELKEMFNF
ncbi:MAG: insulinase family protein, partial [Clostridia bacterium]|nr:insulinase family protein [Clostridia bacterium]